ncbi:flagellar hook-associated protein FlgL [Massilia terrae]|uniref:Flagellar hook-associated protein FlgL n=1 Tax=Massilia terrae TaxID=1811224 RepID=A0ABT2CX23_9BURK|nr:flagellar hook-associated protein FlgL [Massilia terrae]MCS0658116.1 flagellar hook-associated protein FlgL [Massilia terrae]
MRISTSGLYEASTTQMSTMQAQLAKTQMQLGANKRVLTPSDDPVASSRMLEISQSQSMNTQFSTNRTSARNSLAQVDSTLTNVTNLMTNVKTLIVRAGNPSLSDSDRASLATELDGRLQDLVGLANTTDGAGSYLFSGYQIGTKPFTQTATGATYNGDQGQRDVQVGASRALSISDSGSSIFENNVAAKGTFHTAADAANTGTAAVTASSITDLTQVTGHNYSVKFSVTAAGTTYDVLDTSSTPPATVQSAQPYTDGGAINFGGLQLTVGGTPADGDQLTVSSARKQSIFTTLADLAQALRQPAGGSAAQTALTNALTVANTNVTNAMDNVLAVHSAVGSRLQELDTLDTTGDQNDVRYASAMSDLQDLDMVKTISLYSQQQVAFQAAQKSFTMMSGLSLFNYING